MTLGDDFTKGWIENFYIEVDFYFWVFNLRIPSSNISCIVNEKYMNKNYLPLHINMKYLNIR